MNTVISCECDLDKALCEIAGAVANMTDAERGTLISSLDRLLEYIDFEMDMEYHFNGNRIFEGYYLIESLIMSIV